MNEMLLSTFFSFDIAGAWEKHAFQYDSGVSRQYRIGPAESNMKAVE